MKRNNSDSFEPEMSPRSARLVSGETNAPNDALEFKTSIDRDISDLHFRKSVHGYNVDDVTDYIDEQNKNYLTTCQMYDGKIAELRAELAFLNRERDSLLEKLDASRKEIQRLKEEAEQQAQSKQNEAGSPEKPEESEKPEETEIEKAVSTVQPTAPAQPPVEIQPPAEIESVAVQRDKLDDDYRILVDEVAQLRREKVEAQSTIAQLAEIASGYEELSKQRDVLQEQYQALSDELEKKNGELTKLLATERALSVVKDEEDGLKHALELEQKKRAQAEDELNGKAELMSRAVTEIEQLRKEISEFEIRQSVLRQQLKKNDEEIADMREQNKRQAYEYAAKLSDLETDFNTKKLAMQKQIQVHMYHIKQVDLLLNELGKQFGDAKNSLEVIEPSE